MKPVGFYTQEIRSKGRRVGFGITTLDGRSQIFAHQNFATPYRVGKYGVKINILDEIIENLITLETQIQPGLYLIDEIGKMESFSHRFRQWVETRLENRLPVIATISKAGHPWIQRIKERTDVQLLELTPENRNKMVNQILHWLKNLNINVG